MEILQCLRWAKVLLLQTRPQIRLLVGELTGHCLVEAHSIKMGLGGSEICRLQRAG